MILLPNHKKGLSSFNLFSVVADWSSIPLKHLKQEAGRNVKFPGHSGISTNSRSGGAPHEKLTELGDDEEDMLKISMAMSLQEEAGPYISTSNFLLSFCR